MIYKLDNFYNIYFQNVYNIVNVENIVYNIEYVEQV